MQSEVAEQVVAGNTFMMRLLADVPELRSTYEEHLSQNGELLPHVFMADVTRFALAATGKSKEEAALKRLLQCLEDGLNSGQKEVHELILASFVENLAGEDSRAVSRLKALMGPRLRWETASFFRK